MELLWSKRFLCLTPETNWLLSCCRSRGGIGNHTREKQHEGYFVHVSPFASAFGHLQAILAAEQGSLVAGAFFPSSTPPFFFSYLEIQTKEQPQNRFLFLLLVTQIP